MNDSQNTYPEGFTPPPFIQVEQVVSPEKTRVGLPILLLLITILTTLYAGVTWHVTFVAESLEELASYGSVLENPGLLLTGVPYALSLLSILLAHEMGHYLSCRYYGIRATLPFVIPAPPFLPIPPPISWLLGGTIPFGWALFPFNPFGTFGAVIRIKSLFANRRQLFDVGIAGPIAGFVVLVPVLVLGISLSKDFVMVGSEGVGFWFGEPLLFRLLSAVFYKAGDGSNIALHPVGMAAWLGMLATSLNLLPIGQLDGGHVVYALFGAKVHRRVSFATYGSLIGISILSGSYAYLFFALILLIMGFRHPPPYQHLPELGQGRWIVAIIGLIIFVLTFMPVPIQVIEF